MKNRAQISMILPNLGGGGAERVAVNLANCLAHRGYVVDMVLMSATGVFLADLHPSINVINLQVIRVRWIIPKLVRYIRESKPVSVLAFMWPLTVAAIFARALSGVKTRLVVAEHTTWSQSELLVRTAVAWLVRTSMHYLYPRVDGIVAVSHGAANDLYHFAKLKQGTITIIYNPVVGVEKLTAAGPLAPNEWWTGTHRRVLAVGSLTAIKDFITLLNAFACFREKINSRLLILGEGECRNQLEQQIRILGIQDSVFMPGFVGDVYPYYRQADLYVLSSKCEGLPTVIIEALAAGTPVVSTDCMSGPREILLDGKLGRLTPVGDADALADAMAESLKTSHDTFALKNRAQDFSIDKATDQYLKLLLQ